MRPPLSLALVAALAAIAPAAAAQVTTAQYGNSRLNAVPEISLTPRNVAPETFGKVATFVVDGDVYAQPLYLPNLSVPGRGTHDMLVVATEHNSVYAFDARGNASAPLWHASLSGSAPGAAPVPARDTHCPFIQPEVGITATPVIDPAGGVLYALARTREDAAGGGPRYVQRLHAIDVHTGKERRPPVEIHAAVPGTGDGAAAGVVSFDPLRENPRAALLLVHGVLYLAWGSSCDVGPYHGWVMAYDANTLGQRGVLNTSPNGHEAAIWQSDAGLAADSAGSVYAVTGNGSFDDTSKVRAYGSSVLKLTLTARGLEVTDYFTPSDQAELSAKDEDLGSSGPMLLPDLPGPHPHLLFVTGKNGLSYLIDRDAMGRYRPGDNPHAVQTLRTSDGGFGGSAFWNGTLYVWGSHEALKAYAVSGGRLAAPVTGPTVTTDPGAIPVVSSSGNGVGIVWAVETRTWNGRDKPAILHAYDAADVRRELFNSEMRPSRDRAGTARRFAIPTVAGGRVFVGAAGEVDVYGLLAPPPRSR